MNIMRGDAEALTDERRTQALKLIIEDLSRIFHVVTNLEKFALVLVGTRLSLWLNLES